MKTSILAAAAALFLAWPAAATQVPYPTVSSTIDTQLPTNSMGTISAAALRGVLHTMLDSVPVTGAVYPATIAGSTYTYQTLDQASNYTFTSSTVAISLPTPVVSPTLATQIGRGWFVFVTAGPSSALTITPVGTTINGSSNLTVTAGSSFLISTNGANYSAIALAGSGGGGGGGGTVNAGVKGQIAAYSANGTAVGGIPPTCTPAELVGITAAGSASANSSAYVAWQASLGSGNGCLALGPALYQLSPQSTWTLACGQNVTIMGSGGHTSAFVIPATGNGPSFAYATGCGYLANPAFTALNFGVMTTVVNGGSALSVNGNSLQGAPQRQTRFDGIFVGATPATQATAGWTIGWNLVDVQNVNMPNDEWKGPSGSFTVGTAISYVGTSSVHFPTEILISNFDAIFGGTCVSAIGWIQGVIMNTSNCTAFSFGFTANGAGQLQNEFTLIADQFDCLVDDVSLTNTDTSSLIGNEFAANRASSVGTSAAVILAGTSYTTITGNTIVGNYTAAQAQNGIECVPGTYTVCQNNIFSNNIFQGFAINMITDSTATGNIMTYNRSISGTPVVLNGATGNLTTPNLP